MSWSLGTPIVEFARYGGRNSLLPMRAKVAGPHVMDAPRPCSNDGKGSKLKSAMWSCPLVATAADLLRATLQSCTAGSLHLAMLQFCNACSGPSSAVLQQAIFDVDGRGHLTRTASLAGHPCSKAHGRCQSGTLQAHG